MSCLSLVQLSADICVVPIVVYVGKQVGNDSLGHSQFPQHGYDEWLRVHLEDRVTDQVLEHSRVDAPCNLFDLYVSQQEVHLVVGHAMSCRHFDLGALISDGRPVDQRLVLGSLVSTCRTTFTIFLLLLKLPLFSVRTPQPQTREKDLNQVEHKTDPQRTE